MKSPEAIPPGRVRKPSSARPDGESACVRQIDAHTSKTKSARPKSRPLHESQKHTGKTNGAHRGARANGAGNGVRAAVKVAVRHRGGADCKLAALL
jgi:hypothetical protein